MQNESTKTGLIGFFDILCYQNLLERNEPETIAEEVLPILTNISGEITKGLIEIPLKSIMTDATLRNFTIRSLTQWAGLYSQIRYYSHWRLKGRIKILPKCHGWRSSLQRLESNNISFAQVFLQGV